MIMKYMGMLGVLGLLGACASCHPPKPNANNVNNIEPKEMIIGGQKDEHGCPTAAGYTWSVSRNNCVRIWEAGEKFDDLRNPNSSTAIFVIQNGDDGKMELFLPDISPAIILEKSVNFWQNEDGKYRIEKRNNGSFSVYHEGKLIAQSK